ncbi:MAG TPA: [protein-PII] uridylyltransferase [Gammaproteobacteria bacterium]|nr:[protein-PII] uridylyltransferase [Gammaproteobacteria bacterium]
MNATSGTHSTARPATARQPPRPKLSPPLEPLRAALQACDQDLREQFSAAAPVEQLVRARAQAVDEVVRRAFKLHWSTDAPDLALVAVGGYGRSELHPYSDIDLLILLRHADGGPERRAIGAFLATLWDIGLQASHSVRSVAECVAQARADLSVATNLMEARHLAGAAELCTQLQQRMQPQQMWPAQEFFLAKQREQQLRHTKYHDTAYRLEPNVKESPGGLRDIQTIAWVAQRYTGALSPQELVTRGFLTADEHRTLQLGQGFLWRVRFALHLLYGRREDRLLFDAQPRLARQFGYHDAPANPAVEQFMQAYYRTIKELSLLNEMLLQSLQEVILADGPPAPAVLDDNFEEHGGFLRLRDPRLFKRRPAALLEMFHVLQQHPRLKGVSAETLRSLRANLERIDDDFRAAPEQRAQFMRILRAPQGVTHELRRMNRYGVLGRYLPAFGRIVGRMQYDLFHAYTVDEHMLFVIGNLRRFALSRYDQEFPQCSRIMQTLPKPELVYLAALFHDIAKGRGGDHSQLGAQEAEVFCLDHGLSRYDARLVGWLVEHHLLLSLTAQKRDISDPKVVHAFAHAVGDQLHLDYLYVLTVADVRGTNPELWNSWKASLFHELYAEASRALRQGLENPLDKDELIRETQAQALALLHAQGLEPEAAREVWAGFSQEYFLGHAPDEIAWHTAGLRGHLMGRDPLVLLRQQAARGGTAISVYAGPDAFIFARVAATLAELGLTILDARLVPMSQGRRLDTYIVLEDDRQPIVEPERLAEIARTVQHEAQRQQQMPMAITRRAPRQVRLFTTRSEVEFAADLSGRRTALDIRTGDRPGLLSLIGQALAQCEIRLWNAKITTVGERAEDVFFITDSNNRPLDDAAARERLRSVLLTQLNDAG